MKHQHALPAMAAAAVLMLALTACGGNNPAEAPGNSNLATESPTATVSSTPEPTISPSPTPSPSPSPVPTESASTTAPNGDTQTKKGTGIYVGQIDNHSVEIKTEEGSTAFELGAGTEGVPDSLNMDDPVTFEYVEKSVPGDNTVKQRILSKLSLTADSGKTGDSSK